MSKFNKGSSYIGLRYGKWYVIHQTGVRSWTAIVFTHTQELNIDKETVLVGSGRELHEMFSQITVYKRGAQGTTAMRKNMFNILQYGQYTVPKEEF